MDEDREIHCLEVNSYQPNVPQPRQKIGVHSAIIALNMCFFVLVTIRTKGSHLI